MQVNAFYHFHPLPQDHLPNLRDRLLQQGHALNIRGLMILGAEGVNGTLAGTAETLGRFRSDIERETGISALEYKQSQTHFIPFAKLKVKIRREIVTTGDPTLDPKAVRDSHLTPQQWQEVLLNDPDAVVLDTRNWYETRIGKFKRAVDPGLKCFQEFAEYLPQSGLNKDQKILIYCTGGIRCEKAIVEMQRQGYQNVYQLQGGILRYLEEFPKSEFEGECFVFDYRVAVDQKLEPSKTYRLCPHCGQPGARRLDCIHCGQSAVICDDCFISEHRRTCSKNCAHHHRMGHRFRGLKKRQLV